MLVTVLLVSDIQVILASEVQGLLTSDIQNVVESCARRFSVADVRNGGLTRDVGVSMLTARSTRLVAPIVKSNVLHLTSPGKPVVPGQSPLGYGIGSCPN